MKKPKKKDIENLIEKCNFPILKTEVTRATYEIIGYNQACDEWEAYLPSEEEILSIINKIDSRTWGGFVYEEIAKIIHKRITNI